MATISDVAQLAGVSAKTVSRVINNEPHVRPGVKERVKSAMLELNYYPRQAARQLAGNKSFTIILAFESMNASYYSSLILFCSQRCQLYDYHLVSEPIEFSNDRVSHIERMIAKLRPDGIILPPPYCDDLEMVDAIALANIPLTRISARTGGYGYILDINEVEGARLAVSHLISLGHKRIGYIATPKLHLATDDRIRGYRLALKQHNLPFDPKLVIDGDLFFPSGIEAADHLLDLDAPPTAIFAGNDGMALGAMMAAHRRKLRIPDDLAVIGFDDSPAGRMVYPQLTTVRQPLEEVSNYAVDLLLGQTRPGQPFDCTELLVRGSTLGDGAPIVGSRNA